MPLSVVILIFLLFISGLLQAQDEGDCTQHYNTTKSTTKVAVSGMYFISVFSTRTLDQFTYNVMILDETTTYQLYEDRDEPQKKPVSEKSTLPPSLTGR